MILRTRRYRILERTLLVVGSILLAVWAGAMIYRPLASRMAIREFERMQAADAKGAAALAREIGNEAEMDFRLWSGARVDAFRKVLASWDKPPLAIIRIEKLSIKAPVFEGTDEPALNRGVGWIAGTARPMGAAEDGAAGNGLGGAPNIGIAGHRDSFFRGLKDVSTGDAIELTTIRDKAMYTVDQIQIVSPQDVGVLRPRAEPSLTLVTCYPFYFAGDAPKRFIVHASLKERAASKALEDGPSDGPTTRTNQTISQQGEKSK